VTLSLLRNGQPVATPTGRQLGDVWIVDVQPGQSRPISLEADADDVVVVAFGHDVDGRWRPVTEMSPTVETDE
jgi:hypothetical protein